MTTSTLMADDRLIANIADVVAHAGDDEFFAAIDRMLLDITPYDNMVVSLYRLAHKPQILFHTMKPEFARTDFPLYLSGIYLLDPHYQTTQRSIAPGVYSDRDLAADNFNRSEYYKTFYKPVGIVDDIGFLVPIDDDRLFITLERADEQRPFGKKAIAKFKSLFPIIEAAARTHWRHAALGGRHEPETPNVRDALHSFGRDNLSERERQVARLILEGHSTESIARNLTISPDTVWVHRKHIYAKLNISSQAELFWTFLEHLKTTLSS